MGAKMHTGRKAVPRSRMKELSTQELIAVDMVSLAINDSALSPVYLSFVRHMRRMAVRKDRHRCEIHLRFGYRFYGTDDGGAGIARVVLRQDIIHDSIEPAHTYPVWAPETVSVLARDHKHLSVRRNVQRMQQGLRTHSWVNHVQLV